MIDEYLSNIKTGIINGNEEINHIQIKYLYV